MPFLFAVTLFVSAFLLFLVQPMVGKMVLPLLGGTPAVWNTCMVFFQAMLLAGYVYAHASTTRLGVRRQTLIHLVILLLPITMLPVGLGRASDPPGDTSPIPWLLTTLTIAVGLPFFVVATSGPLLQQWFAATGHPSARDPYFLYAASNLGSLLALVAYPVVVEPRWALAEQGWWWAGGYGVFVGLTLWCAWVVRKRSAGDAATRVFEGSAGARNVNEEPGRGVPAWLFLSFVPSSLLLGVTTYLTTDLAAVPLLWVVPLALYLLTFILAFARRTPGRRRVAAAALPVFVLCLALALLANATEPAWLLVPLHLVTFFVAALVCHGELARARPPAERLTEYYLWIAVGGVLGGLFNALLAPLVFRTAGLVEYPLAVLLACAAIPSARPMGVRGLSKPIFLGLFTAVLAVIGRYLFPKPDKLALAILFGVPVMLCAPLMDRPRRFALGLGLILLAGRLHPGPHGATLFYERNFFGVVRVTEEPDTGWHRMVHGNTEHGRQAWDDGVSRPTPLGYYHPKGPAGAIFEAVNARPRPPAVAICGLGAGALAAYALPGQRWAFYEIDPAVARVAQDPSLFTYLRDCKSPYQIVLGDARLRLRDADQAYDLIVIDCFSSDAIPVHLLTREALAVYRSKLAAGGLLALHVSNRYLDLQPVLAALACDANLAECVVREDLTVDEEDARAGRSPSIWVVLAERTADLGPLAKRFAWVPAKPLPGFPVWTDSYAPLLSIFRWQGADD
jgi:hypothetical protein